MRSPKLPRRPSWDELFLTIANEVSKRSSCSRIQAGSVLVKDNRIVSMGYNGSSSNSVHCRDHWIEYWNSNENIRKQYWEMYEDFLQSELFYNLHHDWSIKNEIHSEQNAILFAAKNGIRTENSTIYITHSPCIDCAKAISQAGIIKIVYSKIYDRSCDGLEFLQRAGISCQEGSSS